MNSIKTALVKRDRVKEVSIDKEIDTIFVKGTTVREIILVQLNEFGYPEKTNNLFTKKAKLYVNCAIDRMSESI